MLKKQFIVCLIAALGFLQFGTASAATLSFDPSNQTIGLGNVAIVDLRISGLGADILTGLDLDIGLVGFSKRRKAVSK
jgi:hypothetical protein